MSRYNSLTTLTFQVDHAHPTEATEAELWAAFEAKLASLRTSRRELVDSVGDLFDTEEE